MDLGFRVYRIDLRFRGALNPKPQAPKPPPEGIRGAKCYT